MCVCSDASGECHEGNLERVTFGVDTMSECYYHWSDVHTCQQLRYMSHSHDSYSVFQISVHDLFISCREEGDIILLMVPSCRNCTELFVYEVVILGIAIWKYIYISLLCTVL